MAESRALREILDTRAGLKRVALFRDGEMARGVAALLHDSQWLPEEPALYADSTLTARAVLRNRQVLAAAMLLADIERMDGANHATKPIPEVSNG